MITTQTKKTYMKEDPASLINNEIRRRTIRTWTGQMVDPFFPDPNTIRIDDIAHHLSLICRYTGAIDSHYSVADHSLKVLRRVRDIGVESKKCQLMALLHDAEEAYMNDMASPVKHRYPDYVKDGHALREFIFDKYIPDWDSFPQWMDIVHAADADLYVMERLSFFQSASEAERSMAERFNMAPLIRTPSKIAEQDFLAEFTGLVHAKV